jgi:hypothetical protein
MGYLKRVTIEDMSRIFFSDMHKFFRKLQYLPFARGFPEDRKFNKKELVVLLRAMLGGNGILTEASMYAAASVAACTNAAMEE